MQSYYCRASISDVRNQLGAWGSCDHGDSSGFQLPPCLKCDDVAKAATAIFPAPFNWCPGLLPPSPHLIDATSQNSCF